MAKPFDLLEEETTSVNKPYDLLEGTESTTTDPTLGGITDTPVEGGFVASAKQSVGSTIKGIGQAAADYIPGVEQDNPLTSYGQEVIEANPTKIQKLSDVPENPLTTVTEATGGSVPPLAGMMGVRALGAGITAVAPLTGPAAPVVAGIGAFTSWAGPAIIAALPSYSSIRDKQIFKDPDAQEAAASKFKALLGAGVVGAIEVAFGPQEWALAAMTKEGRKALAKKIEKLGLGQSFVHTVGTSAAIEGAEELVQNPVEQLAAGDNPLTEESLMETALGGVMGVAGGGVMGGVTHVLLPKSKTKGDPSEAVLSHIEKQKPTALQLTALKNSPEQLKRVGLTPAHIDSLLAKHDSGTVETAQFQSLLDSAPNDTIRAGLLATAAGAKHLSIENAETIRKTAEAKAKELSHANALTLAESRRTELAAKIDLTPDEAVQLTLLNKAGVDPIKLGRALNKTITEVPDSAKPVPPPSTDLLHSDAKTLIDARANELANKKFRTTSEKHELLKLGKIQSGGYRIGDVAKTLGRTVLKDPKVATPVTETPVVPKNYLTAQPGDIITLYRGENSENTKDGEWWTTDKAKAERYGVVTEVSLPAEVAAAHAAMGHHGPDEYVFSGKRPAELVNTQTTATPEDIEAQIAEQEAPAPEFDLLANEAGSEVNDIMYDLADQAVDTQDQADTRARAQRFKTLQAAVPNNTPSASAEVVRAPQGVTSTETPTLKAAKAKVAKNKKATAPKVAKPKVVKPRVAKVEKPAKAETPKVVKAEKPVKTEKPKIEKPKVAAKAKAVEEKKTAKETTKVLKQSNDERAATAAAKATADALAKNESQAKKDAEKAKAREELKARITPEKYNEYLSLVDEITSYTTKINRAAQKGDFQTAKALDQSRKIAQARVAAIKSVQTTVTDQKKDTNTIDQASSKVEQDSNVQIQKGQEKASVNQGSQGSSAKDVESELQTKLGDTWTSLKTLGAAKKPGGVTIVNTVPEALEAIGSTVSRRSAKDTTTQALYNPNTGLSAIIANNIEVADAEGILLHEASVHAIENSTLDMEALALFNNNRPTPFMQYVEDSLRAGGLLDEDGNATDANEVRAYIVEHAINLSPQKTVNQKFWQWLSYNHPRIAAYLKKVAAALGSHFKSLGVKIDEGQLNEGQLNAAVASLAKEARDALGNAVKTKDARAEVPVVASVKGYKENEDGVLVKGEAPVKPENVIPLSSVKAEKLSKQDAEALKVLKNLFQSRHKTLEEAAAEVIDDFVISTSNPAMRKYYELTQRISSYKRDKNNQTSTVFDRIVSSPEFYFPKTSAGKKILQAAVDDSDIRYRAQKQVLGDFLDKANLILKKKPKVYAAVNKYLLDTDKTGVGFKLRKNGETWEVRDRKDKVVATHMDEGAANADLVNAEQEWLKTQLISKDARDLILEARLLTNRAFDILIADMRKQITRATENGLDEPTAMFVDADGKTNEVSLTELIANMGDLRGTYFPRERVARNFHLVAEQEGKPSILETFDWHFVENELGNNRVQMMKRAFNNAAPAGRRYQELLKAGYKAENINIKPVTSPTELLFDLPGVLASLDAIFSSATEKMNIDSLEESDKLWMGTVDKALALRVADIYKAKGNFSSRMSRADKLWEGYEPDMIRALTSYASRVSTGVAKRTTARKMLEALTGRGVSWKQYQAQAEKAKQKVTYQDYLAYVKSQRVSPTQQKMMYEDLRQYIKYFLSPDDALGRAIGYFKAATVLKYLGFRVGSAAVNMTTMAMSVPATIAGHTGANLSTVFKNIASASKSYLAYKHNQLIQRGYKFLGKPMLVNEADNAILNTIYDNGWAEAQFNHDAAQAMTGKVGESMNNLMAAAMYMFGAVEEANRAITILATYKSQPATLGMGDKLELSKHTSDRAHGIYGKAAKPWLVQRYRFLDATYTFQKFQHTYHLNMLELFGKYKSPKAVAFMGLMPQLVAGTSVTATLGFAIASLFGADDPEEEYTTLLAKLLGDSDFAESFAKFGVVGAALGVNLKGSLEVKSPFPSTLSELFGAPQALVTDTIEGIGAISRGEGRRGAEQLLPTALAGPLKGHREMTEGVTKSNYAPVFDQGNVVKASPVDFAKRFLSFNPTEVSDIRNTAWRADEIRRKYTTARSKVSARYNRLIIQRVPGDDAQWAEFWKSVAQYNKKAAHANPRYMIPFIDTDWLSGQDKRNFKPNKYTK